DYVAKSSPHDPAVMKDLVFLGMDRTYGDSWARPGLDMRTKSFICMTLTAALGCEDQLRSHIVAAHHTGITKDEMVEWLIHLNGYMGTPMTNVALKNVRAVWKDMAEGKGG
ncbi:MAG: hypothetical protein EBT61_22315, partial [Verrucomicrobia bacterium]|nr:hypothetical protein [Verrucomicrobiota bacterium]